MWNNEIAAVAVAHRVDLDRWWDEFGALIDRIAPRFSRYEPLRHAAGLALGMVSGLDRKNCGTIAEHRGQRSPDGLLSLARVMGPPFCQEHGTGSFRSLAVW
jgi:hypothetical protein